MTKVFLITGCRSGFGLATARTAAAAGWTVYAGLRDLDTADDLRAATRGLDVHPIQLDVTDAEERAAALARIGQEHGGLDALVNNAGRGLGGFLELVEEDELRDLFEVNLFGAWSMTRASLPLLRKSGRATVVMLSSTSGLTALPGLGAYSATKFALEGMAEAWRHELALFGVRVVLIEPGAYATDIFGRNRKVCRAAANPGPYEPWVDGVVRIFDDTAARIARDPQEVADLIVRCMDHPRPALRHPVGPGSALRNIVRRAVPFRLVEFVMQRALARARRSGT